MRKINSILLILILTIVLLFIEILLVRGATKFEPKANIVFSKGKIPEGAIIESNMLEERSVSLNAVSKHSIKSLNDAVGKRVRMEIEEGEMILNTRLCDEDMTKEIMVADESARLFSVEFKADQANGWWLKEGQYVDIIFIPADRPGKQVETQTNTGEGGTISNQADNLAGEFKTIDIKRIRNIRVAALIDDKGNFIKTSERDTIPRYVSFEVSEGLDEFLAFAKGNGRLEISVIPFQNK